MVMFVWGAALYFEIRTLPTDAIELQVVGKQWMWKIQHPQGRSEINELHVPVGQPVRLRMISEDVIHSFYVPAFRVKMDVLPGRYTTLWFEATKPGEYHLFCAEYCGTEHADMSGRVIVMQPADYAEWLAGGDRASRRRPPASKLFTQFRCDTCHYDGARAALHRRCTAFSTQPCALADGRTVHGRRSLSSRIDPQPDGESRRRLSTAHADVQGQLSEEQLLQLDRIHQIAVARRRDTPRPSKRSRSAS